ncbi:hypothetical protein C8J57DRAFT_1216954 [Mycena rebaudengoi]|nr:hypothetical protein C8J57DRAFT_1216954 [Mycena rebaudengoi]
MKTSTFIFFALSTPCANPASATPLHTLSNGTHSLYTTSPAEVALLTADGAYRPLGPAARVFPSAQLTGGAELTPLYRLFNAAHQDHFYTASDAMRRRAQDAGYRLLAPAGWVYAAPGACGSVPLYSLWDARTRAHFYTTSVHESNGRVERGWVMEGVAGYVLEA